MGDFGFDPGIILAGMRQGPSALETMQSLSQMMQQRQQGQMTLAALAQKQQQEQALRGIYQQNADHPEALGQALLRGGFGPEAFGAQDQQYQMAKQLADIREAGMQKLRNRVAAAKTPEQYAEAIKIIPPARLGEFGLTPEFNPTTVSAFVAGGIPAEKQAELAQKDRALGLRVVNTGTGQRMAFNSETGQYDIPVGKPKPAGGGGQGGGIAGSGLTQEAIDSAARRYHESGEMIPAGQGKSGTAIKTVVLNRAAELFPGDSVGGAKADYKASAKSLADAQSNYDAVSTFERTAIKNLDLMTKLAQKIPDLGSTWLNKPVRDLVASMGSQDQVAFNTAVNAVRPEFGKILNGAVKSAGGMSDSSRNEMQHLMSDDMTVQQLLTAGGVLKQDTENRKSSAQEVLKNIRARLRGQKTDEDAPDKTPATASGATVAVRRKSDKVTKLLSPDAAKRAVAEHPDMYELVQ